ncbi:aminoacyl-tRNA hydrolase [Ruminococcus albus]|uniref:Peptidyl-tRNA hydrolase n=1 Tax=Ruminococcus albus TaxID=1264 RepID=A0A1H7HZU8_RUMAL|nr:aminoacyl-tRNA hydrolase [Ruminococcus albus]SEK55142.1 peptidyl-tRNA hydrolase, PTH1 family [Ruminococcus albus]SFB71100.1 peptidyl-tRNA hydrolase, PTH1 family [Ruminococcus albus]
MDIFEKLKQLSAQRGETGTKPEYIIVGLGNPGIQYEGTRHNAGFITIEALEKKLGFSCDRHKFKAKVGNTVIGGKSCLVMKPETFMNLSGDAVSEAMDFYKIPLENVIVIFDDISLDVGQMRIRRKGSAGGHNGIKSIIAQCDGENFPRIKLGVGKKPNPAYDLAKWVLSKFSEEDRKNLDDAAEKACIALELMVQGKTDEAMNKFNA